MYGSPQDLTGVGVFRRERKPGDLRFWWGPPCGFHRIRSSRVGAWDDLSWSTVGAEGPQESKGRNLRTPI